MSKCDRLKNIEQKFKNIVIKVGSNVIAGNDGSVNEWRISPLVEELSILYRWRIEVILVTFGAVAAGRDETEQPLNAAGYVDLIIPRGSKNLIDYVRKNSAIPTIETGAGICHTYFDESGDREKGRMAISNAKTRRISVCNALDCLIINEKRLDDLTEASCTRTNGS